MNVLITGANGQLGTELRAIAEYSSHNFTFTDVTQLPEVSTDFLDITDIAAVEAVCHRCNAEVIVNCAAYTNVEKAEEDRFTAELLNRTAAANLAAVAALTGAVLIHVSTDYVFDGKASVPYKETDPVNPLSVYGSTKLAGERAVLESGCRSIIIRTAWLYSPFGKNFVKTMMALTASRPEINVVADQFGSPTCAQDLAALIAGIIEDDKLDRTGIYHFTDEGEISWYDFACAIGRICGNDCRIIPVTTDQYPTKAVRPQYSVLDKSKVKETFGVEIPDWLHSLKKTIDRI